MNGNAADYSHLGIAEEGKEENSYKINKSQGLIMSSKSVDTKEEEYLIKGLRINVAYEHHDLL